ncbi:MAG: hypothetical protein AB1716_01085 [Planctomycetota bacterium]
MPSVRYQPSDSGGVLLLDGQPAATLTPFDDPEVQASDEVRPVGDGLFEWTRRFTRTGGAANRPVRLTMDLVAPYTATYALIPAVSYNGNDWGSGLEPKGFVRDGVPWSFAFHRCAVPGATYSEGAGWSVALFGKVPAAECGFACSLIPEAGRTTHRLIWPEEEQPLVYADRDKYVPGFANRLLLGPGATFTATAYILITPVSTPRTAWQRLLDEAWRLNYASAAVRPRYAPGEIWDLGVHYAQKVIWTEEGVFRGFSIGLVWDGERWYQRRTRKYEVGWAGQNASLACSLLTEHLRSGNRESLEKGLAALDTWVRYGRFPSGLIHAIIDPIVGLPRRDVHDACNLGNAAADYLEAHALTERCGVKRPEYRDLALGLCDFFLREQQPGGGYGRAWTRDGGCYERGGTIGAFIIPALLAAFRATDRQVYLDSARRAYEAYYGELATHGFTTVGALDTDCIDKESAWPLIDGGLTLYELTGDKAYVAAVEAASYYTASWQWHYSVPIPPNSMLADMGYDSFGGTAVSTQHHHLDPYAVRCSGAWLRLAEITGNPLWRERAHAAWCNGMLGLSDGTLALHGVRLPRGTQCEGYFHTRWIDRGNSSFLLVAWPTAFRLEVLRRLDDWSKLPQKK